MDFADFKFAEQGLLPCIVQDFNTKQVLMLAYMDAHALELTCKHKEMVFWSRSRKEYWHKGKTSGNILKLVKIYYDCDGDTILAFVNPTGPACHTGATSCFFRELDN